MTYQTTTQISKLVKQAKKEPVFITEENQKIGVFISFEYFEELYKLKKKQDKENKEYEENQKLEKKFKEWEKTLPTMEITPEQAESIAEARKEIEDGKCKIMTVDEIMEEITS